ncbi:MAG: FAD:protein FMN transferase [Cyclobacteriaceae bacterium]
MSNRGKNIIYSLLLIAAVLVVMLYRKGKAIEPIRLEGKTMGTSYHVTYFDGKNRNFQKAVDSLLILVNKSISTWDSTAEISVFNRSKRGIGFSLPYFKKPLKVSRDVYQGSSGAYDPTVMPLVNAWGFGPRKITSPDTTEIEEVKKFIGFEKITFDSDSLLKSDPRVQLDFSAIGQGYGADVITDFLKSQGISNMLVEVGGEGMAVGINLQTKESWTLGLVDPQGPEKFIGYIRLENKSFSTSGNYFNYREINGIRYAHTIDPKSGYPVAHQIMSASVFAENCTLADAWATAFMSMGHEKAIEVLKAHPELEACLIWSVPGGAERYVTPGIAAQIEFTNSK